MVTVEEFLLEEIEELGIEFSLFIRPEIDDIINNSKLSYSLRKLIVHKLKIAERNRVELKKECIADFTFVDLFAGIGGFRLGLESVGGKCLGYSEIDKKAVQTYKNNYDCANEIEYGDVKKIGAIDVPPDLIVGGVPCQSWSIAGRNRGFNDPRGELWADAVRIVDLNKPKAFLYENVKGLSDPRHKNELEFLITSFREAGYFVHVKVLDSFNYGVVQSRKRIYLVGFRSKKAFDLFLWPKPEENSKSLAQVLINVSDENSAFPNERQHELYANTPSKSVNTTRITKGALDYFIFNDIRNGHATVHSWDIAEVDDFEKRLCLAILNNRRKKKYGPRDGNPMRLEHINDLVPEANTHVRDAVESLTQKNILEKVRYDSENGWKLGAKQEDIVGEHIESRVELANTRISSGVRISNYLKHIPREDLIYRVFMPDALAFGTLTASGSKDYISLFPVNVEHDSSAKEAFIDQILKKRNYRKLTKREHARLQGFPDTFKLHERDNVSNKQMGNAVSVPVISALAKSIIASGAFD